MKPPGCVHVPDETIERRIYLLRGYKVMLDMDLARLYGVSTKALNQAVKRNLDRFPGDFMFSLTWEESESLRSQLVTLKKGRGQHTKYLPGVFTEQGVAMLSSVLRSPRAIQVNIAIMRAFVRLRAFIASHKDLARRLDAMEKKTDARFQAVFDAIEALANPPAVEKKPRIGFAAQAS